MCKKCVSSNKALAAACVTGTFCLNMVHLSEQGKLLAAKISTAVVCLIVSILGAFAPFLIRYKNIFLLQ